ncbi:MAG: CPBP family intramembrane glutamic endopeptidase [Chthoniobacterales bacterium]
MNPIAKIILYLFAVVLVAILLSPPVFWGLQALGREGLALGLDQHPFHRVFSRIVQIAALVFLWPLIRSIQIKKISQLGLGPNPNALRDFSVGLALAVIPVALLTVGYLQWDVMRIRNEFSLTPIVRILFTAAFVSVFEEFLFRGLLLGLAIQSMKRVPALIVVSAAFSVVHFIKPKGLIPADEVHWMSGFDLLGSSLDGGLAISVLAGGLVTLFVIGMITGFTTLRTRSLWLAIGLHAGWILIQQSVNLFARYRIKPPDALMPWVGRNVVSGMVPTGIVPVILLLVTGLCVWWYLSRVGIGNRKTGR